MTIVTLDSNYQVGTQREYTDEGYLKVPARIARAGIYRYKASEIGVDKVHPDTILRVYRSPDEVFSGDSLKSFAGAVVTDDHPPEMVDSKNFKAYDLGVVMGEAYRDGDYVKANLLIRDENAIRKIESGKQEISSGYRCVYDYDVVNGKVVAGDYTVTGDSVQSASCEYGEYDVIQRGVRANHVAIVNRGRAGRDVRVFDSIETKVNYMQITLDSGAQVEITADNASVIAAELGAKDKTIVTKDSEIKSLQETVDGMTKDMEKKKAELEKKKAELDAAKEENEKMAKKTCDSAINEIVDQVIETKEKCRTIAGDKVAFDTNDIMQLKRVTMQATNDSIKWDDKADAYVEARFDIALEAKANESKEAEAYDKQVENLAQGGEAKDSEKPVLSRAQQYLQSMTKGA